jgi:hypothetical protein
MRYHNIYILTAIGVLSLTLYGMWIYQRTDGYFVGLSWARIRWAHMRDEERERATCLGAHGQKDAVERHPREFCKRFLIPPLND